MGERIQVFISYSHRDTKWLERLQVHLAPLEREGVIDRWDDTRIQVGARWRDEITQALDTAKAAVLLVSADFLASKFIAENELPPLLAAAKQAGARIFPVIVSPCDYQHSLLEPFQAVNVPDKPLNKLSKAGREALLVKLIQAIREALANP